MLSDEDRIQIAINSIKECIDFSLNFDYEDIKIVLNLIEKQSKEIEELTLDLEEMTKSNNHKKENWVHKSILNSYISKDKIKAKIEEYKESGSVDGTNDILITEMQSLLEKE